MTDQFIDHNYMFIVDLAVPEKCGDDGEEGSDELG